VSGPSTYVGAVRTCFTIFLTKNAIPTGRKFTVLLRLERHFFILTCLIFTLDNELPFPWLFLLAWTQALQCSSLLPCSPPSSKLWAQLFHFYLDEKRKKEKQSGDRRTLTRFSTDCQTPAADVAIARACVRARDNSPAGDCKDNTIESKLKKRDRTKSLCCDCDCDRDRSTKQFAGRTNRATFQNAPKTFKSCTVPLKREKVSLRCETR